MSEESELPPESKVIITHKIGDTDVPIEYRLVPVYALVLPDEKQHAANGEITVGAFRTKQEIVDTWVGLDVKFEEN